MNKPQTNRYGLQDFIRKHNIRTLRQLQYARMQIAENILTDIIDRNAAKMKQEVKRYPGLYNELDKINSRPVIIQNRQDPAAKPIRWNVPGLDAFVRQPVFTASIANQQAL